MKNSPYSLMRQLTLIIDSRIRRIEYKSRIQMQELVSDSPSTNFLDGKNLDQIPDSMFDNHHVLEIIEGYSRAITRLLYLRSAVNRENLTSILDLLDGDKYLNMNKNEIKAYLDGSPERVTDSDLPPLGINH